MPLGGMGDGGQKFDIVQDEFAAAVIALGSGLGGVGAAVVLEIQFPAPGEGLLEIGLEALEEIKRGPLCHPRQAIDILHAIELFQHGRVGPPPPSP